MKDFRHDSKKEKNGETTVLKVEFVLKAAEKKQITDYTNYTKKFE